MRIGKALVKLANRLDEIGLNNLADDLDKILALTLSRTPTTNLKKIACIIASGNFGEKKCLFKNRDRNYLPK